MAENEKNGGLNLDGIILNSQGQPYTTIEGAGKKRVELQAENPEKQYNLIPWQGGYAIIETVITKTDQQLRNQVGQQSGSLPTDDGKGEYVKVIFHAKSNPNDDDNVWLSLNGHALLIEREVETIVPRPYLEVARNTLRHMFKQLPGQTRKRAEAICTYPFTYVGPATQEEYAKLKAAGTKALQASVNT